MYVQCLHVKTHATSKHFDCLRRCPIFLETDNDSVIILYVMLKLLIILLLLYMV